MRQHPLRELIHCRAFVSEISSVPGLRLRLRSASSIRSLRRRTPDRMGLRRGASRRHLITRTLHVTEIPGRAFSPAYADHNDRDYQAFVKAVDSGRVVAQTGL